MHLHPRLPDVRRLPFDGFVAALLHSLLPHLLLPLLLLLLIYYLSPVLPPTVRLFLLLLSHFLFLLSSLKLLLLFSVAATHAAHSLILLVVSLPPLPQQSLNNISMPLQLLRSRCVCALNILSCWGALFLSCCCLRCFFCCWCGDGVCNWCVLLFIAVTLLACEYCGVFFFVICVWYDGFQQWNKKYGKNCCAQT